MGKKNKMAGKASSPLRVKLNLISCLIIIVTLCIVTLLDIGIFQKSIVSIAKEDNIKINRNLALEVLFSSDNLYSIFNSAQQQSFMISTDGTVLWHGNASLAEKKVNVSNVDFIKSVSNSFVKNGQFHTESYFEVLKTEREPKDIDMRIWKIIKDKTIFFIDKAKAFLASYDIIAIQLKAEKKTSAFVAYTKLDALNAIVITYIEDDEIYGNILALVRRNIYAAIALIIVFSVFISLFAKTFANPLKSLSLAAMEIKEGKFLHKIDVKNKDEIGILASNFKEMTNALNVFFKYINREVAVRMAHGDIKPGGITKQASILYLKTRDFSSKQKQFSQFFGFESSGKIINWLNNYFSQIIDCVEKSDGIMDKAAGDALMAHWGVAGSAGSPRKDAFNCVKAALMMRKNVFYLNKERRAEDQENPRLYFGCGINSGSVAAGQLGSEKFMDYSAVGDTVDIAAEMEELAMQFGVDILISEDTWRLVGDLFLTDELQAVKIKEKEKPVRLFAVINFTGELKGPQNIDEVRSIIGIEAVAQELEEL